jgi:hypothetical protein
VEGDGGLLGDDLVDWSAQHLDRALAGRARGTFGQARKAAGGLFPHRSGQGPHWNPALSPRIFSFLATPFTAGRLSHLQGTVKLRTTKALDFSVADCDRL